MELRQCGNSGLRLSALGIGGWEFGGGEYWGEKSQDDIDAVVRQAIDAGVNYFDVAEAYNDGRSEESLGRAIRGIPRDRVVLGTKVSPNNTEPHALIEHCDASLRRLGVDFVDLYMVHWPITPAGIAHYTPDPVHPSTADAFATLIRLQEQGKIREIGVSNFGAARLDEALATGARIAVDELPYSLISRAIEREIAPYCRDRGIGVIGYFALQEGLLAGRWRTVDEIPPRHRRTRHFSAGRDDTMARHGGPGAEAEVERALAEIRLISDASGISMADLAIRWAVSNPAVACTLAGTANPKHLAANVRAANAGPLPNEIRARLDAATAPVLDALGPGFDYYESPENDRTR